MPHATTKEQLWVWLFCALAALRIFVYSAAFPFFTNMDEQSHLDQVVKLSHGHLAGRLENFSQDTARFIALGASPEFLLPPEAFADGHFPPPRWKNPDGATAALILEKIAAVEKSPSLESSQPPLYYAAAALWLRLGRWLGKDGISLLYWTRAINVLFGALLVWIGYEVARMAFPEHQGMRLGVPMLVAFIPQDCFYSIENDVLSPVLWGGLLLCLMRVRQLAMPGKGLGAMTGALFAGLYLVKLSNAPLLAVAALAIVARVHRLRREGNLRPAWPALATGTVIAALPIGVWWWWCLRHHGGITGSAAKVRLLTWTANLSWWRHPLFTPEGLWTFVSDLLATLWRGEITWHARPLASSAADSFYVLTSLVCVALALTKSPIRERSETQRWLLRSSLHGLGASFLFLALLSVAFDFGTCAYPSREYPFMTSGRLMSGMVVPFAVLYVAGLDRLLAWTRRSWPLLASVAATAIFTSILEFLESRTVFASEYNWFHL